MKRNFFISLRFSVFGLIAGGLTVVYQLNTMSSIFGEQEIPLPLPIVILLGSIQIALITLVLSFLGLQMMRSTDLSLFKRENRRYGYKLALFFGFITGLLVAGSDRFVFQSLIPALTKYEAKFSFIALLAGIFYGGVVEEVMLRLFLMTFLLFIVVKIKKTDSISDVYYWGAIAITSFLFALLHLPFTALVFGELTPLLILRAIILNGIGGFFFGYLYWRYGLIFSIVSHMFVHISMQLFFIPLFN